LNQLRKKDNKVQECDATMTTKLLAGNQKKAAKKLPAMATD
jgi:hypothetical protein